MASRAVPRTHNHRVHNAPSGPPSVSRGSSVLHACASSRRSWMTSRGPLRRTPNIEVACARKEHAMPRPRTGAALLGQRVSPVGMQGLPVCWASRAVSLQLHDQGLPTWVCLLLGRVCCRRSAFCRRVRWWGSSRTAPRCTCTSWGFWSAPGQTGCSRGDKEVTVQQMLDQLGLMQSGGGRGAGAAGLWRRGTASQQPA